MEGVNILAKALKGFLNLLPNQVYTVWWYEIVEKKSMVPFMVKGS
jgi:hypothetical protein